MPKYPSMTPDGLRRHYERLDKEMPASVKMALAAVKKRRKMPPAPIRFFDQDPPEMVIYLPYTPMSRNQVDMLGVFARSRSKKAFIAMTQRHLLAQGVRAFRAKVEIEQEIHFRVQRERDEDNYSPKWIGDALKGWAYADDAAQYVTWKAPVFVVDGTEQTVLRIRPKGGEVKWEIGTRKGSSRR